MKRIQDQYVSSSRLAAAAGFDAIDIKACHCYLYLIIDLLAAKTRQNSIYGGEDTESRFRFMLETIDLIKAEVPGIMITTRLNISDLYQGGIGVDKLGNPDFKEPFLLVEELKNRGIKLINISMGSPYFNPHITRPFDTPLPGVKIPDEHPLTGVMNMINGTSLFQIRFPGIFFVGSAFSYLRHYAPNVGAAVIKNGDASFIGLGRSSFVYPSLPLDLLSKGSADPIRDRQNVEDSIMKASDLLILLRNIIGADSVTELAEAFSLIDNCITHFVYLSAIGFYIEKGGRSRGSYIIADYRNLKDKSGEGLIRKPELCMYDREVESKILEVNFRSGSVKINLAEVREIPNQDLWFEKVCKEYIEDIYFDC